MTNQKRTDGPITSAELARTPEGNNDLRNQMQSQVDAFLAQGGSVTQVDRGHRVDLPKKPENKYGSRPI